MKYCIKFNNHKTLGNGILTFSNNLLHVLEQAKFYGKSKDCRGLEVLYA